MRSVYRWEGEAHVDPEVLLVAKTTGSALDALVARVRELHPYACPEVVAVEVHGGLGAYLDWVRANVG